MILLDTFISIYYLGAYNTIAEINALGFNEFIMSTFLYGLIWYFMIKVFMWFFEEVLM